jgi:hypothetical protein
VPLLVFRADSGRPYIAGVANVVFAFATLERADGLANGSPECFDGAGGELAQVRLENALGFCRIGVGSTSR